MARQCIGIFVCTFDPVHSGHLNAARCVAEASGAETVLFALLPGSGSSAGYAPSDDRLRMITAAAGGSRKYVPFVPDPDRKPLSGISGLVSAVHRRFPVSDLVLFAGSDSLPAVCCMEDRKSLSRIRSVWVSSDSPPGALSVLRGRGLHVELLPENVSLWDLSSESLRKSIAGGDLPPMLPCAVSEYIACKGLYGFPARVPESGDWIESLHSSLKPHRFSHSLAVAHTARELALRFGEDPLLAEKAGLLHDCAKSLPLEEMRRLVRESGIQLDPETLGSTALLHSVAGACLARKSYGVSDPVLLEAMSYHNTGYPGMTRLAMCVCLGDSIEPTRPPYPLLSEVRLLAESSLEKALLRSLEGTADYVRSQKGSVHPRTLETISWLKSLPAVH